MKRSRILAIALMVVMASAAFGSTATGYKFEKPLGLQVITNPTSAVTLTVPAAAKHALISIRTNGAMLRDDGTAPTTTVGLFIPAGTLYKVDNDRELLKVMTFINSADGPTTIYILYYGDK